MRIAMMALWTFITFFLYWIIISSCIKGYGEIIDLILVCLIPFLVGGYILGIEIINKVVKE